MVSPHGSDSKESACYAGDPGSIPGSRRSPGEGNGSPLQCSCWETELAGYSSWGRKESNTTERLSLFIYLSLKYLLRVHCDALVTLPGLDRHIRRTHPWLQVHFHCLLSDKPWTEWGMGRGTADMDKGQQEPLLAVRPSEERLRKRAVWWEPHKRNTLQCAGNPPNLPQNSRP